MLSDTDHSEAGAGAEALVLGIETSCDECAAAVVAGRPGAARIVAEVVLSQIDLHEIYGGVVPELAARAHADTIDGVVAETLRRAGVAPAALAAVAATAGPGLLGGLLVGTTFGKALAAGAGVPFVAVNHLEAHVLTARLTDGVAFPFCVALLSGGHAQFIAALSPGRYVRLGGTIDDAAGEAFDKTAKLLGLPYPGGPAVEKAAREGDAARFDFPVPLLKRAGCDLSFAGLKTAVRVAAQRLVPLTEGDVADICAGFQASVAEMLRRKSTRALTAFEALAGGPPSAFVVVGGVAANAALRTVLRGVAETAGVPFVAPPPRLCTDNGAMIAYAGLEARAAGTALGAATRVRSRWPLDTAAPALIGAGKRGAKG
ncbi:MAG: tRNA (adenosine(37)-N6)-threonylcarbamoyltransferase complex transferase subunit TsaD [Acuticoccus sp.]